MRGKALLNEVVPRVGGITPAYAGKSSFFGFCFLLTGDHPRVCGEKAEKKPTINKE